MCIRLDNSGAVETLDTTSLTAAYIKGNDSTGAPCNLLDNTKNPYLGTTNKILLPF